MDLNPLLSTSDSTTPTTPYFRMNKGFKSQNKLSKKTPAEDETAFSGFQFKKTS